MTQHKNLIPVKYDCSHDPLPGTLSVDVLILDNGA